MKATSHTACADKTRTWLAVIAEQLSGLLIADQARQADLQTKADQTLRGRRVRSESEMIEADDADDDRTVDSSRLIRS